MKNQLSASVKQYTDKCPCTPGHTCVSTGVYEVPQGEHGEVLGRKEGNVLFNEREKCFI